jgi:hypothetical protein
VGRTGQQQTLAIPGYLLEGLSELDLFQDFEVLSSFKGILRLGRVDVHCKALRSTIHCSEITPILVEELFN